MARGQDQGASTPKATAASSFLRSHPELKEAVILLLAGLFLLGLGASLGRAGVGLFFTWVPVAALTARQGTARGLLLAGLLALPLLGNPGVALAACFGSLTGGVLVGWGLREGWGDGRTVQTVALVQLAGMVLGAAVIGLVTFGPRDLVGGAQEVGRWYLSWGHHLSQNLVHTAVKGGTSPKSARIEGGYIVSEMRASLPVLPALLALALIANVALATLASDGLLRAMKAKLPAFPPFALWSTPAWMAVSYLVGLALIFALPQNSIWSWIGTNIATVCQAVLFVHGLALLYYGATRIHLTKTARVAAAVILAFIPLMQEILAIVGVVDAAADIRKLQGQKSS